jgi:hypothetical protein
MKAVLCSKNAVFAAVTVLPIILDTAEAEAPTDARLFWGPPGAVAVEVKKQFSAQALDAPKAENANASAATGPTFARRVLLSALASKAGTLCVPV